MEIANDIDPVRSFFAKLFKNTSVTDKAETVRDRPRQFPAEAGAGNASNEHSVVAPGTADEKRIKRYIAAGL